MKPWAIRGFWHWVWTRPKVWFWFAYYTFRKARP